MLTLTAQLIVAERSRQGSQIPADGGYSGWFCYQVLWVQANPSDQRQSSDGTQMKVQLLHPIRGQRHSVCVLGGLSVHLSTCTIIRHGCRLSLQPITPPSCTICTQASAQSTWLPSELRQSELVSRCTLVNIGVRFPGRNYTMLNDKQILHNARQGYQTCDLILWSCAFKCGSCNWCQHG